MHSDNSKTIIAFQLVCCESKNEKYTLPKTNSSHLIKMDGWNTFSFPFGGVKRPIFRCELLVSGSPSPTSRVQRSFSNDVGERLMLVNRHPWYPRFKSGFFAGFSYQFHSWTTNMMIFSPNYRYSPVMFFFLIPPKCSSKIIHGPIRIL